MIGSNFRNSLFAKWFEQHSSITYLQDQYGSATFGDVLAMAQDLAGRMPEVRSGSTVVVRKSKTLDWAVGIVSLWLKEASPLPVAPDTSNTRIERLIRSGSVSGVLSDEGLSVSHGELCRDFGAALKIWTSGSTGSPKLVSLGFGNLEFAVTNSPSFVFSRFLNSRKMLRFLPFHHLSGLHGNLFMPLSAGGTLIDDPQHVSPSNIVGLISKHQITDVLLPSSWVKAIGALKNSGIYSKPILLWIGGDITNKFDYEFLFRTFPSSKILNCYSLSECPRVSCGEILKEDTLSDVFVHVGEPSPGMAIQVKRIFDEELIGEVLVRGPALASGIELEDGWYNTGDLGYLDRSGRLVLVGRKSARIKYKSVSIYPERIESEALMALGRGDFRVALVGLQDELAGQRLVLLVQTDNRSIPVKLENLRRSLEQAIPREEWPDFYFEVDKIPTTSIGKIDRGGCVSIVSKLLGEKGASQDG